MASEIGTKPPSQQTAALVDKLGGELYFKRDYPVPTPGENEVLVKVLYTGVCQSDLHTKNGTASSATGDPITAIKFPHVGGHEGVGRVIALGPGVEEGKIKIGTFLGIRFLSRVCHECSYCLAGEEQYCKKSSNHLHHEDGSFQEYIVLDTKYPTILPDDIDPSVIGPVLCAGVTAYKAVKNANLKSGEYLVVMGAGGGLGHLAVQYGLARGAKVIGIDGGKSKKAFVESLGAHAIDFTSSPDVVEEVRAITGRGADAAVVTTGNAKAYNQAVAMLRDNGVLCCVGIPVGNAALEVPIAGIVIKGLRIFGNLVGSLEETLEAVEMVRKGDVKPHVVVRDFEDLPKVYDELEKGDISGRVVLKMP